MGELAAWDACHTPRHPSEGGLSSEPANPSCDAPCCEPQTGVCTLIAQGDASNSRFCRRLRYASACFKWLHTHNVRHILSTHLAFRFVRRSRCLQRLPVQLIIPLDTCDAKGQTIIAWQYTLRAMGGRKARTTATQSHKACTLGTDESSPRIDMLYVSSQLQKQRAGLGSCYRTDGRLIVQVSLLAWSGGLLAATADALPAAMR
jgi:hypothetical protein